MRDLRCCGMGTPHAISGLRHAPPPVREASRASTRSGVIVVAPQRRTERSPPDADGCTAVLRDAYGIRSCYGAEPMTVAATTAAIVSALVASSSVPSTITHTEPSIP